MAKTDLNPGTEGLAKYYTPLPLCPCSSVLVCVRPPHATPQSGDANPAIRNPGTNPGTQSGDAILISPLSNPQSGDAILIPPLSDLSAGLFLPEIATDEHSYLLHKNLGTQGLASPPLSAQSRQLLR